MEPSIFRFVWKYSWRQQLVILALTALSLPVLYASLELPKIIVNEALGGQQFVFDVFGYQLDRTQYLFVLCFSFLALVVVGGALKYVLNVYSGVVAERMLRRLRFLLYEHMLRFPLPHFRKIGSGELIQMINAEVEPLGGYVAAAFTVPAFQGGTLLTILLFVFMQDWKLALAAIALYPVQIVVIPRLQRRVNRLAVRRVHQVRRNAQRIGETASGILHIHADDATLFERARFGHELGKVFFIRFDIYKTKYLIKFINNFIGHLGPFLFFSIGGYLVIQGDLTLGALVAVLNAHKDMISPWKELLQYYQLTYDVKVKYEQVISQFTAPRLLPQARLDAPPPADAPDFVRELRARGVVWQEEGERVLDGIDLALELPVHAAVVGPPGSGRRAFGLVLAGLLTPDSGRVWVDDQDLHRLPESVLGRRIGYVGPSSWIFDGRLRDNLLYGLRHHPRPLEGDNPNQARRRREALLSGNPPLDPEADWVDEALAGPAGSPERLRRMVAALKLVGLYEDVYRFGLAGHIRAAERPELAARLLQARRQTLARLAALPESDRVVEPFHVDRYNPQATVAENLLFGTPVDRELAMARLAEHPYVQRVLEATGLARDLLQVGYRLAETVVELFSELPPDDEFFTRLAFVAPEQLPELRRLLSRLDPERLEQADLNDRVRLLSLAFHLVPARHRLGLLTPELQRRLVEARHWLRRHLPPELEGRIAFFDPERYNDALSIEENLVFGKLRHGRPRAAQLVGELVREVLRELELELAVVDVGLDYPCGVGGQRLGEAQRQKLAIARELMKQPRMLVLHHPTAPLDPHEAEALVPALRQALRGRTLIWIQPPAAQVHQFERVVGLEAGRVQAVREPEPATVTAAGEGMVREVDP